jgi:hypothetical protein
MVSSVNVYFHYAFIGNPNRTLTMPNFPYNLRVPWSLNPFAPHNIGGLTSSTQPDRTNATICSLSIQGALTNILPQDWFKP